MIFGTPNLQVFLVVNFSLEPLLPVGCPGIYQALPQLGVERLGFFGPHIAVALSYPRD